MRKEDALYIATVKGAPDVLSMEGETRETTEQMRQEMGDILKSGLLKLLSTCLDTQLFDQDVSIVFDMRWAVTTPNQIDLTVVGPFPDQTTEKLEATIDGATEATVKAIKTVINPEPRSWNAHVELQLLDETVLKKTDRIV